MEKLKFASYMWHNLYYRRLCILWNFTGRCIARHKGSSECFIGQPCDGYDRCRREVRIIQVRHPSQSSRWQ